jgi:GWxTD domain-containing protein
MFNKNLLICFCLLISDLYGQIKSKEVYFEVINALESPDANCFITFKTPFNQLVFVKDNSNFTARFTITAEAKDSITKNVIREFVEKRIIVNNYEQSISNDLYVQGLIKLKLPAGKYNILPVLNDENSNEEFSLNELKVEIPQNKNDIISPVVIAGTKSDSIDSVLVLANNNGFIPFSHDPYDMMFIVPDTSANKIALELFAKDTLVEKKIIDKSFLSPLSIVEANDEIHILPGNRNRLTRNFIFHLINKNLKEGNYKIVITIDKHKPYTSFISVVWFNKPKFLDNLNLSFKILKYIAGENELERLSRDSEDDLYADLFNFWKKYDPTPDTIYNELMDEYYQRADYAIKNFSVLGTKSGAETDRGKIYLQFGKPSDIKRIYTNSNDISEIWIYKDLNKKFIFNDRTGTGDFQLQN